MKDTLRRTYKTKRNALSPTQRTEFSQTICSILSKHTSLLGTCIAVYIPTQSEVDIGPFIQKILDQHLNVFCPRLSANGLYELVQFYSQADLTAQHHGILEPGPHCPGLTLETGNRIITGWIVPGLAFDSDGHRLGYGKGIYDRLLAGANGIKWGICFDVQRTPTPLPKGPHDIQMDRVITETTQNFSEF